ncbi:MAG: hypothetical protein OXQ29_02640 [Rhodospirillaceae bacterium]|nr:hypothetical protein [Rhodospirillaceae bacterium]
MGHEHYVGEGLPLERDHDGPVGAGTANYVSEPNRGRRKWKGKRDAQKATYGNGRRIRGERGERLERTFAHLLVAEGCTAATFAGRRNGLMLP